MSGPYANALAKLAPEYEGSPVETLSDLLVALGAILLVEGADEAWEATELDFEERNETVLRLLEDGATAMGASWADCNWALHPGESATTAGWQDADGRLVRWKQSTSVCRVGVHLGDVDYLADVDLGHTPEVVLSLLAKMGASLRYDVALIHSSTRNRHEPVLDALVVIPLPRVEQLVLLGLITEISASRRRSILYARATMPFEGSFVYRGSPTYHVAWLSPTAVPAQR